MIKTLKKIASNFKLDENEWMFIKSIEVLEEANFAIVKERLNKEALKIDRQIMEMK